MVVAAAYIDGRQQQWPTPMIAVLIMTRRGGGVIARDGRRMHGRGEGSSSSWHK